MVKIGLVWLSAAASVIALLYTLWPERPLASWQLTAISLLSLAFLIACGYDIWEHWRCQAKKYKTKDKINGYMHNWISKGGHAVIFTRDHTWAYETSIRDLLVTKAHKKELTMCLPADTDLSRELHKAGAEVISYSALGHIPASRFTIINSTSGTSAAIAVGRQVDGTHVIEEFPVGDPVFAMASDLVEILRQKVR